MSERIFGGIPDVPLGSAFQSRLELSRSGVHRPTQAGISGSGEEGADSIVLSGGYPDDEDFGSVIIYTGHGGQDPDTRKQIADQELERQNLALAVSMREGLPVRVVRGSNHRSAQSPATGYRYDGLFTIERFWHEVGAAGFKVWRFRLVQKASEEPLERPVAEAPLSPGNALPGRSKTSVSRVVRDFTLGAQLKRLYDFSCQVCGIRLQGPAGPYAEAAHIRPLGRPHNGPDTSDNLICLCPNHHYLFDVGAFGIGPNLELIGVSGQLALKKTHRIDPDHLLYHRTHFGLFDDYVA